MTVGEKVIEFYKNYPKPSLFESGIQFHNPYDAPSRKQAIESFCGKFYGDDAPRIHLVGINPSRLKATSSGVNYTDGYALQHNCGIENAFSQTRELTAEFFYEVVEAFGGASTFHARVLAWAALPIAMTANGQYINYYQVNDNTIVDAVKRNFDWLTSMPSVGRLIVVGLGENRKFIEGLTGFPFGYNEVRYLPHPRWVIQYNRSKLTKYVDEYLDALS